MEERENVQKRIKLDLRSVAKWLNEETNDVPRETIAQMVHILKQQEEESENQMQL